MTTDAAIATPDQMAKVGRIARILITLVRSELRSGIDRILRFITLATRSNA
ncbi:hypothetical protein LX15_005939 [Streptoalloteichus tenebrarius]|uniref:Transposase n=1 Tax=Streptoalloteichus tenebrarius (strain ATCC 17920 / DSM 40477 / JCM 4838 / CBS 697.72 / NBRC 16177 / NCIMB 11028 / NRRL B-12390 / A12253. 1 / ISP 5477) TaxID=1933 RepID=A0ABT1I3Q7_STRSD|nr:hypothetical protein [Streptoalloteichus tenebrarius]MCP2262205.1 hypothetical protein [Streptoalloteichus tenebrarius]BFE98956.1 hypothetical protein GCM10020241_06320 [Streptoalloteichus tenebrarius]